MHTFGCVLRLDVLQVTLEVPVADDTQAGWKVGQFIGPLMRPQPSIGFSRLEFKGSKLRPILRRTREPLKNHLPCQIAPFGKFTIRQPTVPIVDFSCLAFRAAFQKRGQPRQCFDSGSTALATCAERIELLQAITPDVRGIECFEP